MRTVWIRRGFRWVPIDEAKVLPGQFFLTEPPTEAAWVAARETAPEEPEEYTPRRRRAKAVESDESVAS